jgi:uncharacterized membrane protein
MPWFTSNADGPDHQFRADFGVVVANAGGKSFDLSRPAAAAGVAALTAFAAVLHFCFLQRPCLWLDEAATYWRICGSFHDVLRLLREQGFPPLHYAVQWTVGQFIPLTPAGLRVFPAVCGTLMVPAMYCLTIRLMDQRATLRVAALTVASGFVFEYARDAKMYMPLWLLTGKLVIWASRSCHYLPMQNELKILPKTSSGVTWPAMPPNRSRVSRSSNAKSSSAR